MKHKILIIVIIVIHSFPTLSQVNLIYRDDSSSYLKVLPPINYGDFDIRLKDSMPDGRYLLINAWRKDSVANIDHFLIESSQYIGKLRNGPYYRFYKNKKGISEIIVSAYYKDGLLDGKYQRRLYGESEEEINFSKGLRNGFSFTYTRYKPDSKYLSEVKYYINDTLKDWWNLGPTGDISRTGYGRSNTLEGKSVLYNKDGYIESICYLSQGIVTKYEEYYPNLVLKKVYSGEFRDIRGRVVEYLTEDGERNYHVWSDWIETVSVMLDTGKIEYYSNTGKLIKTEHYRNNRVIDNK